VGWCTCTRSALPWLMARTSASARWHFKLHSLHTRTGVVYMFHGLQREHETCSGAVLEAGEGAAVAGALAAEHEAAVPAVVPPHEQAEVSPARPNKSDAQDSKGAVAMRGRRPAVHALALAVVVDPRGPLRTV
jgi:hypothetical protein